VTAALVVGILLFVEETLRLGNDADTVFSLLTATFAAGTALGALVARSVEKRIGRMRLMAIGYLAPLMLVPAGLTPPLPVLFACLFILGFTDAWAVIAMQTYLAEAVPDALRGRVYATWLGAVTLAGAAGFGVVGWLTPRVGPPVTLALVGAVVGIGGPLLLLATGAIAAMRREAATDV
jgi:MFS family permease